MLRAAIMFFVVGLIAMLLGAGNIAGLSMELGRTLLIVFVVLAVLSLIISVFTGRRGPVLSWALILILGTGHFAALDAFAARKTSAKMNDAAGDASVSAKKHGRQMKRSVRNATGNGSASKDLKDKANDVGDQISNNSKKAKRKIH